MKNIKLILILIFTTILELNILPAQNRIYVHPTLGNDGNNGRDIDHPLKTIYTAGLNCHGGDTIFIRGGPAYTNFSDRFYQVDILGITPVWIMPYFNETVILDGSFHNFKSYEAILNIERARNVVIQNLHVRNNNNGGAGIRVVSNDSPLFITKDVLIKNCLVHNTYRQGILVQASNVTVDSCEIYNAVMRNENQQLGDSGWEFALGTYHWPDTVDCWTNIIFKNNFIYNSWGEGIVALRCYNFIIENNHVQDCFSGYIYIDNSRKGVIRNNWVNSTNDTFNRHYDLTFYAPGIGIQWAAENVLGNSYRVDSLISDLEIYNNLIVRTNSPISWWRDIRNTYFNNSYKNINVYYNTIYNTYGYQGFYLDPNTAGVYTPTNCNFKNNIICKGQYPLGSYKDYITTSSHYQNWSIDYNCFIHNYIPGNIPIMHNIQGSPSFIDTLNINIDTNFRIKSNSNCKSKGIHINEIDKDYWHNLRDNSLPCIGIHEYGGISGTGSSLKLKLTSVIEGMYYRIFNMVSRRDTFTVELRKTVSPYNLIASKKGVLDSLNFISLFQFPSVPQGTYYIIFKHFNSIVTWSKSGGETFNYTDTATYNFTSAASQAYGNNLKLKGSKYCIISGDVDRDGYIDASDASPIDNDSYISRTGRFLPTDLNGDNFVDAEDMNIQDNNRNRSVIQP